MGFGAAATGVNAIAIGSGATATGSVAMGANAAAANGGAAYGDNSVATGANAAAFGTGAQATAANSVAIGAGSVASAANTVSFGAPGAERRVTNVAAGIAPTDAVNMGQLTSMASGFQSQDQRQSHRGARRHGAGARGRGAALRRPARQALVRHRARAFHGPIGHRRRARLRADREHALQRLGDRDPAIRKLRPDGRRIVHAQLIRFAQTAVRRRGLVVL